MMIHELFAISDFEKGLLDQAAFTKSKSGYSEQILFHADFREHLFERSSRIVLLTPANKSDQFTVQLNLARGD